MEILKIAALSLIAVILITIVKNYKKEFAIPTAVACSILILYYLLDSLRYGFTYITDFYNKLEYGKSYYPIIIKALAIAYITEFTSQLCKDAGESSIASKVELAGKIFIFIVAVPVFASIFNLVTKLL
ncbi:MAG: stage III sporulation protein AD [Firmicutes bacterium]|nr:stage III sporulation protein AD [Bacillota bacterium]